MDDVNRITYRAGDSPDERLPHYESRYILANNCLHASACGNYRGGTTRLGQNICLDAPPGASCVSPCAAAGCPRFKEGKPSTEHLRRDKHTCEYKDTVLKESSHSVGGEVLKVKIVKKEYIERCNGEITEHREDVRVILEYGLTALDACSFEELQSGGEVLVTLGSFYSYPGHRRLADLLARVGFEEAKQSSSSRRVFILQKGGAK